MLAGEPVDVDLQGDGPDRRAEVEQTHLLHRQKISGERLRPRVHPAVDTHKCAGHQTCLIPNQSARSRALASAVDSPTTRTALEVWEEIKLVLDTITSSTGPLSSPGRSRLRVMFSLEGEEEGGGGRRGEEKRRKGGMEGEEGRGRGGRRGGASPPTSSQSPAPSSLTEEVDLIDDQDGHLLDVTAVLPASAHPVPLLWGGDDEVSLCDGSHVWSHVTSELHHPADRQRGGGCCCTCRCLSASWPHCLSLTSFPASPPS